MAAKKNQAAKYASPSQIGRITKGTERAGKTKTTTTERQKQNKGIADGTVRLGKAGKSYNVYDAKSGTWKRGVVKAAPKTTRVSPSARGEGAKPSAAAGNIPYGGSKRPSGKEVGPGAVGVKAPTDGALRRFGSPGNMDVYRYSSKTGRWTFVRKSTPGK